MFKKKSLADELADLVTPAPQQEFDPDATGVDEAVLNDSDVEAEEAAGKPSRRAPEKALRLQGDIELDDVAYKGRKSSRAAFFGEDDGSDGDLESDDDGEESMDGEDEDEDESGDEDMNGDVGEDDDGFQDGSGSEGESEEGDDDEEQLQRRKSGQAAAPPVKQAAASRGKAGVVKKEGASGAQHQGNGVVGGDGSDDDDAGPLQDSEDGDGDDGEARAGRVASDPALRQLEEEYETLQAEDEAALVTVRQKSEREVTKGQAVRCQQVLYERSLEMRILLQKALQGGSQLPRTQAAAAVAAAGPLEVRTAYTELRSACCATLDELLELQQALFQQNQALASTSGQQPAEADGKPRKGAKRSRPQDEDQPSSGSTSEAYWSRIQGAYAAFAGFRDASLDRWHRRTVLSSGSAALRNSLRALNQSVSNQVAALMRDPSKFIHRTQLTLTLRPKLLCAIPEDEGAAAPAPAAAKPARVSSTEAADAMDEDEEPRDVETYDDSEFYQQLLKEFLDKGSGAGAGALLSRGPKRRKVVDRRASKGRKIRYNVQEKLVNFMAPVATEPPPFAAQLFANMFGHAGK